MTSNTRLRSGECFTDIPIYPLGCGTNNNDRTEQDHLFDGQSIKILRQETRPQGHFIFLSFAKIGVLGLNGAGKSSCCGLSRARIRTLTARSSSRKDIRSAISNKSQGSMNQRRSKRSSRNPCNRPLIFGRVRRSTPNLPSRWMTTDGGTDRTAGAVREKLDHADAWDLDCRLRWRWMHYVVRRLTRSSRI